MDPPSTTQSASNSRHQSNDYNDLDAILADQQFIPCTFKHRVQGMGYLTGSDDQEDILPDTTINLPMWVAEALLAEDQDFIDVDMPRLFSHSVLRGLDASAPSIDLYNLSPYYFRFAQRFIRMAEPPLSTELSGVLSEAFRERLTPIMDHTQTRLEEHSSTFVQGLDMTERDILKQGQLASERLKKWQTREPVRIKPAQSLSSIESSQRTIN